MIWPSTARPEFERQKGRLGRPVKSPYFFFFTMSGVTASKTLTVVLTP